MANIVHTIPHPKRIKNAHLSPGQCMLHKAHCQAAAQWKQWWKGGDLHLFTLSHATIAYDRHCADIGKDHHHDNICVTHTQPQPPELTLKVGNLLKLSAEVITTYAAC